MCSARPRRSKAKPARADARPQRRQDAAPGGIPAEDPRLHQAAPGHRARQLARHLPVGHALTSTISSLVAPSPSAAIARASSLHSSVQRVAKRAKSGPFASTGRAARPPVGHRDHAVVGRHVPVDGDGVERVVDRRRQAASSTPGATMASVAMKQSMVAICGWIIPEPLADGDDRHRLAAQDHLARRLLVGRSVVRMASAAREGVRVAQGRHQCRHRRAHLLDRQSHPDAPRRRSQHLVGRDLQRRGHRRRHRPLVLRSGGPVIALALPLLATMARMPVARQLRRRIRDRRRAQPVDGEHAGRRGGHLRHQQRDRAARRRLQMPAAVAPDRNPCGQTTLISRSPLLAATLNLQVFRCELLTGRTAELPSPAVSSKPNIKFAFCTA